jgi:Ca2+-binding RTX toxin-like protein
MVLGVTDGPDSLVGYDGADSIAALGGNDTIHGQGGDDSLDGGSGNDLLWGGDGSDLMTGGSGADTLYGEGGDDTLVGGTGSDNLQGNLGNDLYLFSRGDGIDTINDNDSVSSDVDTLQFVDIASTEVTATREGSDLLLSVQDSGDSVRVSSWFHESGSYELDVILFSDDRTWGRDAIHARIQVATEGNDTLTGYDGEDTYAGLGGNDYISGNGGDDSLDGGSGSDTLFGGEGADSITGGSDADTLYGEGGDDTLAGGTGSDYQQGNLGNDLYLFSRGDGIDTINDYDSVSSDVDTLRFVDIASTEVTATREGGDLLLSVQGTTDSVRVSSWFAGGGAYELETIRFSDGVLWNEENIRLRAGGGAECTVTVTYWNGNVGLSGVSMVMKENGTSNETYGEAQDEGEYRCAGVDEGDYTLTANRDIAAGDGNAITVRDALASLKFALGMHPEHGAQTSSSYQYLAADVNRNGHIEAGDALDILKMALNASSAPASAWVIVPESTGGEQMSRDDVRWPDADIPVTVGQDSEVQLVGVLLGDVDGSWSDAAL